MFNDAISIFLFAKWIVWDGFIELLKYLVFNYSSFLIEIV